MYIQSLECDKDVGWKFGVLLFNGNIARQSAVLSKENKMF